MAEVRATDMYEMGTVTNRPHVVILGAGASCAAIPNGDRYGRKIPVMRGFLKTFGLEHLLTGISLNTDSDNIEDIYSELSERPECLDTVRRLESAIFEVMSEFQIPQEPTVYDYLLLSLREKDVIATFNWDPLLLQAYKRAHQITRNLPAIYFLHGNVAVGHSTCEHMGIGLTDLACEKCNKAYAQVPLLYPVKHKDYVSDWWIKESWNAVQTSMRNAGALTIFGYSAPKSDVEAVNLLKQGWGAPDDKPIQQTEFIDLKELGELEETWRGFVFNGHCASHKSFFESKMAWYPRRTVEADIENTICNNFISHTRSGLRNGMSFSELREHLQPLLRQEDAANAFDDIQNDLAV